MPKHRLATIEVYTSPQAPGFFLIRFDGMEIDAKYVWCGEELGWRPVEGTTPPHSFATEEEAEKAAEKYGGLPLSGGGKHESK
jgi:hypothetical protein